MQTQLSLIETRPGPPIEHYPGLFAHHEMAALHAEMDMQVYKWAMHGKSGPTPREERWFHDDPEHGYRFGGKVVMPAPWGPRLKWLRTEVEEAIGERFNSCFANFYRDGADTIPYHRDFDKPWVGPVIASVSLGGERIFRMRRQEAERSERATDIMLRHGDLLVLREDTDDPWNHSIPRCKAAQPRLNLTFRQGR